LGNQLFFRYRHEYLRYKDAEDRLAMRVVDVVSRVTSHVSSSLESTNPQHKLSTAHPPIPNKSLWYKVVNANVVRAQGSPTHPPQNPPARHSHPHARTEAPLRGLLTLPTSRDLARIGNIRVSLYLYSAYITTGTKRIASLPTSRV